MVFTTLPCFIHKFIGNGLKPIGPLRFLFPRPKGRGYVYYCSSIIYLVLGIIEAIFIRNNKLQFVSEEKPDIQTIIKKQKAPKTKPERLERLTGINLSMCRTCKKGRRVGVRELPRIRWPSHLQTKQPQSQI